MPYGGVYNETTYEQRSSLIRNGLTYKGSLTEDLSIDVLLGQEFRNTNYKGLKSNNYGYFHDREIHFMNPLWERSAGEFATKQSDS